MTCRISPEQETGKQRREGYLPVRPGSFSGPWRPGPEHGQIELSLLPKRQQIAKTAGMNRLVFIVLATSGALTGGCVEREMTITSEPSGALVIVSGKEVGRTPVTQSFLWYGDYEIVLRRQDYRTLKTHANLRPPIYEIFPLDLLSEIAPWTYHDRRYLHYRLEELKLPDNEDLIRRGDELKARALEPVKK